MEDHAGQWRKIDDQLVQKALSNNQPARDASSNVLLGQTISQLEEMVSQSFEQPKYRGKQLHDALLHGATSVRDIHQVLSRYGCNSWSHRKTDDCAQTLHTVKQ